MPDMAAKAGLSVLLVLYGWLHEGVTRLEQKDYPAAVAAFTKVVEHEAADVSLRRRARIHRATAHGLSGEIGKARADVVQALGEVSNAVERAWIFACLAERGLEVSRFLPRESPKDAFAALARLSEAGDEAGFRKRLSGGAAAAFATTREVVSGGGGQMARELKSMFRDLAYVESTVGTASELGTAKVVAETGRGRVVLGMVAGGDDWRLDALLEWKPSAPVRAAEARVVVRAAADLPAPAAEAKAQGIVAGEMAQQAEIVKALHIHSQQNGGNLPQKLAELAAQLGDRAGILEFADPATGRKLPRLYRALGTAEQAAKSPDAFVVATPVAIAGRRVACSFGGRGEEMAEDEFFARARRQGWEPDPERRAQEAKALKERVDALIVQLGDTDGAKRKAAYRELKALGDETEPMLEPHRNHPDPEVRMSVRELLKGKARSAVPGMMRGGMGQIEIFGD